ncbi:MULTISPECIES: hypothetical protein [Luteimonas]|uniref:hypothetical protein n=1 Tax=Luteimonas TaxID=83614 RepID=UPI00117C52FF|nr:MULTISPECIES: hypothetical protein [Luteimonas]
MLVRIVATPVEMAMAKRGRSGGDGQTGVTGPYAEAAVSARTLESCLKRAFIRRRAGADSACGAGYCHDTTATPQNGRSVVDTPQA